MKHISKLDSTRRQQLVDSLTVAENRLIATIETHNETVRESWRQVDAVMSEYNDLVREANGFREDVASEIEAYMDERSDKWREGEVASNYEEWKAAWEQELNEVELSEPEEVATDLDESAADVLRGLEEEVAQ